MNLNEPIIDVWMQHPNLELVNHPMFESLRRWMKLEILTEELPIEFTLAAMDEAGVKKGLLCAWWGPCGEILPNSQVAHFVKTYPDRFIGVGAVNLYQPMQAIETIRKCVLEYGFKAIRIIQWLWNLPPTDRRYYPVYAECIQQDIPVCFQVGHTGPLCPSDPGRPIPYIDEVALDFPDLKIVCGHIGYPWTNEMIAVATKYPNVYIDTSAYISKRYPPELVAYMKAHGRTKVMFGTDHPVLSAQRCLDDIEMHAFDEDVLKLFLHENAARVFKI